MQRITLFSALVFGELVPSSCSQHDLGYPSRAFLRASTQCCNLWSGSAHTNVPGGFYQGVNQIIHNSPTKQAGQVRLQACFRAVVESKRHLITAKWPRTHCVFSCAGSANSGGMAVWEGDSCRDCYLPFFLPPFISPMTGMIRPSGVRSARLLRAANFSPLQGSPAWALAWLVQPVKMLAEWIWSSSADVLCEKINEVCKLSSLLLKWQPKVPRAKVHIWTCLWRVSNEYSQSSAAEAFPFDQSIDAAWLVCLWAGRDVKCLFQ